MRFALTLLLLLAHHNNYFTRLAWSMDGQYFVNKIYSDALAHVRTVPGTLHCGRRRYINLFVGENSSQSVIGASCWAAGKCWALTGSSPRLQGTSRIVDSSLITCCREPSAGSPAQNPAQERLAQGLDGLCRRGVMRVMEVEEAAG